MKTNIEQALTMPVIHTTAKEISGGCHEGSPVVMMWVPVRVVFTLVVFVLLAGCSNSDDGVTMTKDEARAKTHELTDALAKRVGTNPEKGIDGPVGGLDSQSSPYYTYDVTVDVEPGTLERIRGELFDDLREQGWRVRDRHPDEPKRAKVSFLKEDQNLTMGITVTEDKGYAVVNSAAAYTD